MTGLGTRHTLPRLPSASSSREIANPCLGCSQIRQSTSHSDSDSERSSGEVISKG